MLSGATGKLLHILRERLCAQFQSFDHRKVREKRFSKVVYGHLRAHGNNRCLDEFTSFGRNCLNPE